MVNRGSVYVILRETFNSSFNLQGEVKALECEFVNVEISGRREASALDLALVTFAIEFTYIQVILLLEQVRIGCENRVEVVCLHYY